MDPIADLLSTIKNSMAAQKDRAQVGYSKIKEEICKILSQKAIIIILKLKKITAVK